VHRGGIDVVNLLDSIEVEIDSRGVKSGLAGIAGLTRSRSGFDGKQLKEAERIETVGRRLRQ
jgi:hypothetical protein